MSKENRIWKVVIGERWKDVQANAYLGSIKITGGCAKEASDKALIAAKGHWSGNLIVSSVECTTPEDIDLTKDEESEN